MAICSDFGALQCGCAGGGICRLSVHVAAHIGLTDCICKWPESLAQCWQRTGWTQRTCFTVEPDMLAGILCPLVMAHSFTDLCLQDVE